MGDPTIRDKRWTIDLEKRIQEDHFGPTFNERYSFDPRSNRELFVIDTPPPYPSAVSYTHLRAHETDS